MGYLKSLGRPAVALLTCAAFLLSGSALAASTPLKISLSAADSAAVAGATSHFLSATPKNNLAPGLPVLRTDIGERGNGGGGGGAYRYPADLINNGGPTIATSVQVALYLYPTGSVCVSPSIACWGNANQFLTDLNASNFVHVTDQYVGTTANNRYPFPNFYAVGNYSLPANPLTDADMAAWAHAAATAVTAATGTNSFGYSHVYHIFLAPEQNVCFDTSYTVCSNNYFCGYHSSWVFTDGEVVYTVEPYQLVPGCNVKPGTPNGAYDATYNVLSHEFFETVTDPEGSAYWNSVNNGIYGEEIGDECSFIKFFVGPPYVSFDPSTVWLNGHAYATQPEYSNRGHVCTTGGSN